MKLTATQETNLPDHKIWDLCCGLSLEGEIAWLGPKHELVVKEGRKPGYYVSMVDHATNCLGEHENEEPFDNLNDAIKYAEGTGSN